jgi:hypothetical protein
MAGCEFRATSLCRAGSDDSRRRWLAVRRKKPLIRELLHKKAQVQSRPGLSLLHFTESRQRLLSVSQMLIEASLISRGSKMGFGSIVVIQIFI